MPIRLPSRTMRTRAGAKLNLTPTSIETTIVMGSPKDTLLKLLVLPKDLSSEARICTLAHPRTSNPSRYYFCPEKGVFEFIRIAASNLACQSWLIGPQHRPLVYDNSVDHTKTLEDPETITTGVTDLQNGSVRSVTEGYVAKSPELFIATPIDPLFLVLPR
jgi:hypothetical protein